MALKSNYFSGDTMKTFYAFIGIVTLLLLSCGKEAKESSENSKDRVKKTDITFEESEVGTVSSDEPSASTRLKNSPRGVLSVITSVQKDPLAKSSTETRSATTPKKRLIIKNGEMTIEINQYDQTISQLTALADTLGGYLSETKMNLHYSGVKEGFVQMRIPAEKFDLAVERIRRIAVKVEQENAKASDVTEEFFDLEARLNNKRKAEARMTEILKTAKTVNDILSVEQSLTAIREDIERYEGRLRYLSDQIALSTINITLHEPYPITVSSRGGFWNTIGDGFVEGFRGFAVILSGTITFLIAGIPVFALIYLIIFILIKLIKQSQRKRIQVISQSGGTSAP